MLRITVPAREFYDESKGEFVEIKEQTLIMEHSLISISKWESKWKKPYLSEKVKKTDEEVFDYLRCMTITPSNVDPLVYRSLSKENIEAISDYEYQVIKAPIERMDVSYILQENGFVFAETAFDLSLKLKNLKCPDTYTRYIDYTSYSEASSEEVKLVDSEIRKGIFNTDKVALDPLMSTELSGQRFANWFTTEVESGKSKCYLVNLEDKPIGFFGVKDVNEKASRRCRGAKMLNGVRSADVVLIRI